MISQAYDEGREKKLSHLLGRHRIMEAIPEETTLTATVL